MQNCERKGEIEMKKFFGSVVCISLVAGLSLTGFTGCTNKNENTVVTNDGGTVQSEVNFGDDILVKGDGIEISADTIGYYIYQCAMSELRKDGTDVTDITGFDWDKENENGEKLSDVIKRNAVKAMENKTVLKKYGNENGFSMSDDEKEQIRTSMQQLMEQQGSELFSATLNSMGISSIDAYLELYENETVCGEVKNDFESNRKDYIKNDKKMQKYRDDDNVSVQHILIKNTSTKYDDPKAAAEEVLEKARKGEDFTELMQKYNEDSGESKSGYSFGHGEMVTEFENASFELDYDEISDIVETTYGYHIIKRVVGLAEYQNYLVEKYDLVVNDEALNNISVKEIMNSIANANEVIGNNEQ